MLTSDQKMKINEIVQELGMSGAYMKWILEKQLKAFYEELKG